MDDWERPYRLLTDEYSLENHDVATWREAELWACDRHGWREVDEASHDATERLHRDPDIDFRYEIKSCKARLEDGSVGRLTIWPDQIVADELAVVVYDETQGGRPGVVAHDTVSTGEIVTMDTQRQNHPSMGWSHYYHPRWTDLLDLEDVRLEFQDELRSEFV